MPNDDTVLKELILKKLEEVGVSVKEVSSKLTTYAERVDNVVKRVDGFEGRVQRHGEMLAEHKQSISTIFKVLALVAAFVATLTSGIVVYYVTHQR